jgi:hypothetical protein
MSEDLARLPEDQPEPCASCGQPAQGYARGRFGQRLCHTPDRNCYRAYSQGTSTAGDLVPGYGDSADGRADAADQARMDGQSGFVIEGESPVSLVGCRGQASTGISVWVTDNKAKS